MKERIKKCFETPKKMVVSIACIVAILVILGAGSAYAATSVAKSSAIGEENAKNFAFADAGVDPAAAENVVVDFEFEGGQFVYDVEFDANGSEYEYWIKASDGTVVKRDVEIVNLESASGNAASSSDGATDSGTSGDTGSSSNTGGSSSGNTSSNKSAGSSNSGDADNASSSNAQSGSTSTSDGGTNSNSGNAASNNSTSGSYISVDEAKSIALGKAGLSASQVSFTKTKLENDDGIMEYEIEFYQGRTEYEVTINATTGAIIDYDVDYDD